MGTVRSLVADLRDVATRERTDGTTRRRPGDAARAVVAVLLLVPLILHAHHPTATEEAVVRLYDSIPQGAAHALPDPLPARGAVGGGAAGGHRPAPPALAPGPRPRGRGRRGVGARPADGLPACTTAACGTRSGSPSTSPAHPASRWCACRWRWRRCWWRRPTSPGRPAASARASCALLALSSLYLVARVPHRPDRRHRARLGRRRTRSSTLFGTPVGRPGRAAR